MELQFLIPIFGILLVMIPVAGITFALTLRFAVRPFVETLAAALRESGAIGADRTQLTALARAVENLETEVERLREAQAFDRELLSAPGPPSTGESSAPGRLEG